MNTTENFFKGIPTKIDTDRLSAKWGVPSEGTIISFESAAKVVGHNKDSHRFRSVFSAWRKMLLRDHNVLMVATGDGSVVAANPTERIEYATKKVASGRRAVGKAIVVAYGTPESRLDEKMRAARDSVCSMNSAKLRLAAGVMPK